MWTKTVGRKELADILNTGRLSSFDGLHEAAADLVWLGRWADIEVIWKDDPRGDNRFPAAIIVDAGEQRDLLAWLSTYSPMIRPITAYSHLSDRQTAAELLTLKGAPRFGKFEDVWLGLIVGETTSYVGGKKELRNITHTACLSSLSFSIARAAGFGFSKGMISDVQERWSQSRSFIGALSLPVKPEALQTAWSVIRHLSHGEFNLPFDRPVPSLILDVSAQLLTEGSIREPEWSALTYEVPQFGSLPLELTRGPREDRLAIFEHAIRSIRTPAPVRNHSAEFMCGYLASAISPGTMDHLHVLQPYLFDFPSLPIWYGLCAGLSSRGSLGMTLNGLVRRVKRELTAEDHFLQTPSCDIAFPELKMMSGSAREWSDFRLNSPGQLVVELFPSINAHYRFPRSETTLDPQSGELAPALNELATLLDRTSESISRFRRVAGIKDPQVSESQREKRRKAGK